MAILLWFRKALWEGFNTTADGDHFDPSNTPSRNVREQRREVVSHQMWKPLALPFGDAGLCPAELQ